MSVICFATSKIVTEVIFVYFVCSCRYFFAKKHVRQISKIVSATQVLFSHGSGSGPLLLGIIRWHNYLFLIVWRIMHVRLCGLVAYSGGTRFPRIGGKFSFFQKHRNFPYIPLFGSLFSCSLVPLNCIYIPVICIVLREFLPY